ncbi:MAG TPA: hypothetical protein VE688_03480 [Gaiellaceae bacterium]|jgi:hypothetical protein|nr:hypothetical protein [Gaiellaceae bacterium]
MAARNGRSAEQVRRDIEAEREQLADAVEELRGGLAQVTDIGSKLRSKLPLVAAGALGAGFFLGGGIGATMRLLARRGREGATKAKLGPFSLVDRDD